MKKDIEIKISPAIQVIIIFGIISMLGDVIYETARSANSQYFSLLGISATKVGLVFGVGEFLGYFLRLLTGVASDRSGNYWGFLFLGYGLLIVVPIIGFSQNWNFLLILILLERIGKALRNPSKDTVLSAVAENQVGVGFAFGLQEALDQIGAFLGPLIFTAVFYFTGKNGLREYQTAYKLLIIPFVTLMLFLYFAKEKITSEKLIPSLKGKEFRNEKLPLVFWYYSAFTFFCSLGFVNFSLIGYHLKSQQIMSDGNITLLYSLAMAVDAITALIIGKAYDSIKEKKKDASSGLLLLLFLPIISILLPLFALNNKGVYIAIGMLFFGIIMGVHETIMRSAIADISPFYKRGTSYGIFNSVYGLALFAGAWFTGFLYEQRN